MATEALSARVAPNQRRAQEDPAVVRWGLVVFAAAIVAWLVVIPLLNVFYEAFARGPKLYWDSLVNDPDTLSAILLTLRVAPAAVREAFAAWADKHQTVHANFLVRYGMDVTLPLAAESRMAQLVVVGASATGRPDSSAATSVRWRVDSPTSIAATTSTSGAAPARPTSLPSYGAIA